MSEIAPVTDESVIVETAAVEQPQPMIHDQAYWDQDAETAAQNWEHFRGTRLVEMDNEQLSALVGYMWKTMWQDHQVIKALALETPAVAEVKPARRRTPKAKPAECESDAA